VNRKTVLALYEKLAEAASHGGPIRLHVHSDGGCCSSALAALHHMRHHPCPITTIADGFCASAATLLFLGGSERIVAKHASMLIHQLRTCFIGRYDELCDEYKNSTRLMATLRTVYKEHTRISDALLDKCLTSEEWLSADDCLAHGIAQRIM
jgi:ATP-dependent protease ClpP protease subunit